ncbi:MAG: hypothetical protein P1P84_24495, partial [Deferrisomatales bacterium]|nr:hypothetical protein [Deferrisomatales bacterium]
MQRKALLLILTLGLAAPVAAPALELGAKIAYWMPQFTGQFRLDAGGVPGTLVDAGDDLGIDEENSFFGEAWLWVGDHHLTLSGVKVDYSGEQSLNQEIVFGGQTFVIGGRAASSIEYVMLDLAYQYDIIDLENPLGGFSLGPILQVKYLDGDVKMSGDGEVSGITGHIDESEEFRFPLPMVGLGAHVGVLADWLELRLRGVGMAYQGDSILDLQGEAALTPFP